MKPRAVTSLWTCSFSGANKLGINGTKLHGISELGGASGTRQLIPLPDKGRGKKDSRVGNMACGHISNTGLEDVRSTGGVPGQWGCGRGGVRDGEVNRERNSEREVITRTCSPSRARKTWGEWWACHRMLDKGLQAITCWC